MKQLRAILDELVEHRLWPVVAALAVALVAVPVALSKKAPAADSLPASSGGNVPTIASPDASQASDVQPGSGRWLPKLAKHDPFVQHGHPTAGPGDSTASAPPKPTSGGGTSGTLVPLSPLGGGSSSSGSNLIGPSLGGGTSVGGGSSSGGGSTTVPPQHKSTPITTLTLHFGAVGGSLKSYDLDTMEALPSSTSPVAIYVGLDKGTKNAVFLVPYNVKAEGDGKCSPSGSNCQTVHISPGDTEFFDYTDATGNVTQYELDYVGPKGTKAKSKKSSKQVYVGTTKAAGRALRRELIRRGLARAIANIDFDTALTPPPATPPSAVPVEGAPSPLQLHPIGPSGVPAVTPPAAPAGTPAP